MAFALKQVLYQHLVARPVALRSKSEQLEYRRRHRKPRSVEQLLEELCECWDESNFSISHGSTSFVRKMVSTYYGEEVLPLVVPALRLGIQRKLFTVYILEVGVVYKGKWVIADVNSKHNPLFFTGLSEERLLEILRGHPCYLNVNMQKLEKDEIKYEQRKEAFQKFHRVGALLLVLASAILAATYSLWALAIPHLSLLTIAFLSVLIRNLPYLLACSRYYLLTCLLIRPLLRLFGFKRLAKRHLPGRSGPSPIGRPS